MSIILDTLTQDIAGAIHGTTVNKITNLYGIFTRAAGAVVRDHDLMETKKTVTLGQVFTSIYNYASPTDLKGNRIIDIRPQAGRKGEVWPQRFNQWFDRKKYLANSNQFTVVHNGGVKSLRIDAPFLSAPVIVANPSSTTGWSAGGTASNLTADLNFMVAGQGALQFDVTTGTGYIETSSLSALDLTDHLGIAQEFLWMYFPSAPTSVNLRWGSSTTAYYSGSATAQADGTAFQVGWNLITIPWSTATTTGSPTITGINTVRVSVVAPAAMVGVKFCYLTSILGQYLEMVYYSKCLFRDPTTGAFKNVVVDAATDAETILNVDTESYDLMFNKCMFFISQQLQGDDAKADKEHFAKEYMTALTRYKNLYPSEVQFSQEQYYQPSSGADYNGLVPNIWTR